jgi:hypothetical protein
MSFCHPVKLVNSPNPKVFLQSAYAEKALHFYSTIQLAYIAPLSLLVILFIMYAHLLFTNLRAGHPEEQISACIGSNVISSKKSLLR